MGLWPLATSQKKKKEFNVEVSNHFAFFSCGHIRLSYFYVFRLFFSDIRPTFFVAPFPVHRAFPF